MSTPEVNTESGTLTPEENTTLRFLGEIHDYNQLQLSKRPGDQFFRDWPLYQKGKLPAEITNLQARGLVAFFDFGRRVEVMITPQGLSNIKQ